jgi:hypothetical protein
MMELIHLADGAKVELAPGGRITQAFAERIAAEAAGDADTRPRGPAGE